MTGACGIGPGKVAAAAVETSGWGEPIAVHQGPSSRPDHQVVNAPGMESRRQLAASGARVIPDTPGDQECKS